jgi:hypothetical protein
VHKLERIAFFKPHLSKTNPADNLSIVLDDDRARIKFQLRQDVEERTSPDLLAVSIDYDIHSRILRAASAGSTSSHRARMAATP